ncbi:uncharacterized protein PRCAT00000719001 [Priceomyces carsonii]|uniref:uncharacterized protein n=1 Tax=Priceomyces carsonii TaxID=28549 RepID=UPI002ED81DF2|nr:unnamed protein product [Priceomyces carsonii]
MKLINSEEKAAHIAYFSTEGFKGLIYGSLISFGLYEYIKTRQPGRFRTFSASIKTCILIIPTIGIGAFWADQGSVEFDRKMHSSNNSTVMEEYRQWNNMTLLDKVAHSLLKYKSHFLVTSWIGSIYGSWILIRKDKTLNAAQRISKIKKYAIGSTASVLMAAILVSRTSEALNSKVSNENNKDTYATNGTSEFAETDVLLKSKKTKEAAEEEKK